MALNVRKSSLAVLSLVMAFSLNACGGEGQLYAEEPENLPAVEEPKVDEEERFIAIDQGNGKTFFAREGNDEDGYSVDSNFEYDGNTYSASEMARREKSLLNNAGLYPDFGDMIPMGDYIYLVVEVTDRYYYMVKFTIELRRA